jgi:hypothetical protein
MTTLILDQLRTWRDNGGPEQWLRAWDRVIALYSPVWQDQDLTWGGAEQADGAAAVVLGIYLIAVTDGVPVEEVSRADLDRIRCDRRASARVARWRELLVQAGHAPEEVTDPISACWRRLIEDATPPDYFTNPNRMEDPDIRFGPILGEALDLALAPVWSVTF